MTNGIDYNTNFSTSPYLRNLATEAKYRAVMIYHLSFGVPPNLLRLLANGLVIGKILAAYGIFRTYGSLVGNRGIGDKDVYKVTDLATKL